MKCYNIRAHLTDTSESHHIKQIVTQSYYTYNVPPPRVSQSSLIDLASSRTIVSQPPGGPNEDIDCKAHRKAKKKANSTTRERPTEICAKVTNATESPQPSDNGVVASEAVIVAVSYRITVTRQQKAAAEEPLICGFINTR